MPRNSAGLYELPPGNPVISGTIIESLWANETMEDIADALTASLPRNGTAPMTGPLTLVNSTPSVPLHAASKGYVDKFIAYSSGMPIGFISPYGGGGAPGGWLLCDGSPVSRTTYPDLFAAIGTIYGPGDGVLTFNLPDLRNEFIRGLGGTRTVGSKQAGSLAAHNHAVTDPGHTHPSTVNGAAHTHEINIQSTAAAGAATGSVLSGYVLGGPTAVGVFDSGQTPQGVFGASVPANSLVGTSGDTGTSFRQLDINIPAHTHSITAGTDPGLTVAPTVAIASAQTGVTIDSTGGSETVPQNMALRYYIKAVHDADPLNPDVAGQRFLGFFDASPGLLPQAVFPSFEFQSGDFYEISKAGDLYVFDPVTKVGATTTVAVGDYITWVTGGTDPEGWYRTVYAPVTVASDVSFVPSGNIGSTNVQDAIEELDAEKAPASASTAAGTSFSPYGNISSTNVQLAIQELDDEKANVTQVNALDASKVAKAGDTMTGALYGPLAVEDRVQIGRSDTASQNFTFDTGAAPDGHLYMYRGNAGTVVAAVMTVDPSNNVAFLQDVTAFSDERLKKDWEGLDPNLLGKLVHVKVGTYRSVGNAHRSIGVSAQSLRAAIPEAVRADENGYLSVAYGNAALAACVALAGEVERLKARVEELETRL